MTDRFPPAAPGVFIRYFCLFLIAYCLPYAGARAQVAEFTDLDLAVSDVFPAAHTELAFAADPQALLLAQASTDSAAREAWESALPPADKFDWVQTTSGEWLKGEFKVLYSGSLEFDSDEFGLLTLDWDDVAQFRGQGTERVRLDSPEGPIRIDGVVTVTKDKVFIATDGETSEYDRHLLIAITPGATTEWDNWTIKLSLGLNFSRGNTDQTDFTSKINIRRRTPENRFVIDYLGNLSVAGNIQTVNNHRLNTFFDIFATREYFWRPVFAEYYRDPFQNIDYRATIGAGGGYHIIDTPDTNFDVSGGPGFRATRYVSVQPGDSQKVTTPALVAGIFYDTALTKTLDFNARYNLSIVNQESGTYTHHAIATFEIELTSLLDFDVSFVWDRTQDPQVRADGSTPKQDDFQLLLTLGVDI